VILITFSMANAATFVVTNANDVGDGSLRWAIERANLSAGVDTILFDASYTIYPQTELPALVDATGGTTIDVGSHKVVIDGSMLNLDPVSGEAKGDYGLKIASDNNIVNNLHVRSVPQRTDAFESGFGIWITGNYNTLYGCKIYLNDKAGVLLAEAGYPNYPAANHNKIQACYIGSSDGLSPGQGNGADGIYGFQGAKNTIIGVDGDGIDDAVEGNVISGNGSGAGIFLSGPDARIAGNLIGVDKTGTMAIPNTGYAGIRLWGPNGVVGTDGDGVSDELEGNVISGNNLIHGGVILSEGTRFSGNYVGVDITGTKAIPNQGWGVRLPQNSTNILIGTDGDGISDDLERNIISGNQSGGIFCSWSYTIFSNLRIWGNYIGTDVTGAAPLGNSGYGIHIYSTVISSSDGFYIGTNGDGLHDEIEANVISANSGGVYIGTEKHSFAGVTVSGNFIGTDHTGAKAIPNRTGVRLFNATDNIIGTDGDGIADDAEGNVIVALNNAIELDDWYTKGAEYNKIAGNKIGMDITGKVLLGNGTIYIDHSHNNIIGTDGDGISDALERNIIAGGNHNLYMTNSTNNQISGNYFGLTADGTTPLGSVLDMNSIYLVSSNNNIIGTNGDGVSDELEGNTFVTSGAKGSGIQLTISNNNIIAGNNIGTDESGTVAGGFGGSGISIVSGSNNIIGTNWDGVSDELEGNIIANNGFGPAYYWHENDGVANRGLYNAVRGNSIYNNAGQGIDLINGGNQSIATPTIDAAVYVAGGVEVSGTAVAGSTVEIYTTEPLYGDGEGKSLVGKTDAAADGSFSTLVNGVYFDDLITATATDPAGNTSEFSVSTTTSGNQPPVLTLIGDKSVNEMETLVFTVTATDPENESLSITAANLPEGAAFDGAVFAWTPDYSQAGSYQVTVTAGDSMGGSDAETFTMTVIAVNAPPAAAPAGGGTYRVLTDITLGGQVSDYDGETLNYQWFDAGALYCAGQIDTIAGGTAVDLPACVLPEGLSVGSHLVTLQVSDGVNIPVAASITIEVIDTTAPTLAPQADRNILWPPNHEMEEISIVTNVWDESDCYYLDASVISNEPEDGLGDGDTGPDSTTPVIDPESDTITLSLRAERAGKGDGRVYSVEVVATDCSGNSSSAIVEVSCPHDRKGN
jgi:hypothetical protein